MQRTKCPYCAADLNPGNSFCTSCGRSVDAQAFGTRVAPATGNVCSRCGTSIVDAESMFCPNCGSRVAVTTGIQRTITNNPPLSSPKNPTLAGIISLFIWGLGPLYNGQTVKGLIFIVLQLVVYGFSLLSIFVGVFSFALAIFAAWDAYNTAKRINMGEVVGSGLSFTPT